MALLKDSKRGPEATHTNRYTGVGETKESMSSFGSGSTRPFHDGFMASDPRLPSQRFDSFSNFDADSPAPYVAGDDVFSYQAVRETQSPPSVYLTGGGFSKQNGFGGGLGTSEPEEGFALREWRRRNAIELEEKEKEEKEKLQQIIEEAEAYKTEFYWKRKLNVEKKKACNREIERVFLENQEKFHAEAEENYWKAIAELIPREVAAIEKRGKKEKDREKKTKASVVVIHEPKPGKPTDLSRMRQILVKLKQSPPSHMNPKP